MQKQVLAVRGVGGYRQYRIPAMAVTPSGRIITIYDARLDFDDLPGPVDLVIRISDDNGATWSDQRIFREHQGVSGFGDASIIIDPTYGDRGRIIVLYQWTHTAGFFESVVGTDQSNPLIAQIARSISDDDGVTWRHDVITNQLKDSKTPGIFATSGMGGRIAHGKYAGRLLQSFVLRRKSSLLAAIGFSDDHGETWKLGAEVTGGNETAVVGLHDGSILLHSRATPNRLVARSIDGGLTLLDVRPEPNLLDPSDNGSLLVLNNGDVICTHNHDADLRRNTVIKRSTDGGETWTTGICVESNSSAYSTSSELSDGSIAILYERNAYQEIVFAKYSMEEFKPIEMVIGSNEFFDEIEFIVVPRYIRPGRNHEIEKLIKSKSIVPEVDMSAFKISVRKEVGQAGGSTSGDHLYTAEELEKILGPGAPGLHTGDEIRFSARVFNRKLGSIHKLVIKDRDQRKIFEKDLLGSNQKECILDIRQLVSEADVIAGIARYNFELNGSVCDDDGSEISEFKKLVTVEMPTK